MTVDEEKGKIHVLSVINNSLKLLIATLMLQFDNCQIEGIVLSRLVALHTCTC